MRKSVSSDEVINAVEKVEMLVAKVSELEAIINANQSLFKTPVRKTGWVARLSGVTSRGLFNSKLEARDFYPEALSYHEITWE